MAVFTVTSSNGTLTSSSESRDFAIETYQAEVKSHTDGTITIQTNQSVMGFIKMIDIDETAANVPDDNWDLVIKDEQSNADLTNGLGTNITVDTVLGPSDLKGGMPCSGKLTLTFTQMGSENEATVTIYILRVR